MKPDRNGAEYSNVAERAAKGVALTTLAIGAGALVVQKALHASRNEGVSFADYAKKRAVELLERAKPLAVQAFDYVQERFSGLQWLVHDRDQVFDVPVASSEGVVPEPAIEPVPSPGKAANKTESDQSGPGAEQQPEEAEPTADMSKYFENGDKFIEALTAEAVPEEIQYWLQALAQTWKLGLSIDHATKLWDTYLGPTLQNIPAAGEYPAAIIPELQRTASELLQQVTAAVEVLETDDRNRQDTAFAIYQKSLKIPGGHHKTSERSEFAKAGEQYIDALSQVEPKYVFDALNLSDTAVNMAIDEFFDTTDYVLEPEQAEQLVAAVRSLNRGAVTMDEVMTGMRLLHDRIGRSEVDVRAKWRQAVLAADLYRIRSVAWNTVTWHPNGEPALTGASNILTVQKIFGELDQKIHDQLPMSHDDIKTRLNAAKMYLERLPVDLAEDAKTVHLVMRILHRLQQTV